MRTSNRSSAPTGAVSPLDIADHGFRSCRAIVSGAPLLRLRPPSDRSCPIPRRAPHAFYQVRGQVDDCEKNGVAAL